MSHCKIVHKKTSVRAPILRRSRDIGTHHAIVSASQQETEAMVLAARREEWSRERSTQTSDSSDSEVDFFAAWPVTGESYCRCSPQEEPAGMPALEGARPDTDCLCGEDDQGFDWVWDEGCRSSAASLSCEDRKVSFHSDYSCGTAAIRGNRELADGQHFWEIKMTSPVYGTDMMVGIGTSEVNLEDNRHRFCSMLGADEDSWGLSYTGLLQHKGDKVSFSSKFGQGSIIGLHLDTWHGTLTFYKNRRHIGVAATKLQNKKLYPMVCSTAAKSSMKVIRACYTPTSLQYLCCSSLRRHLPACPDTLGALPLPPGLRHLLATRLGWIFSLNPQPGPEECEETPGEPSPPPSARSSPSACSDSSSESPVPDLVPCRSPCSLQLPGEPACSCLPAACKDDSDGCSSEPEDYQSKRCRWT